AVGERDEHVAGAGAGGLQGVGKGAVAGQGADVEPVLQIAQQLVVDVDDRHLVRLLAREVMGGGASDLAGTEDDDSHGGRPAMLSSTSVRGGRRMPASGRGPAVRAARRRPLHDGYSGSSRAYASISH